MSQYQISKKRLAQLIKEEYQSLHELGDPRRPSPMSYEHEGAADDFRNQVMNLVIQLAPSFSICLVSQSGSKWSSRRHQFIKGRQYTQAPKGCERFGRMFAIFSRTSRGRSIIGDASRAMPRSGDVVLRCQHGSRLGSGRNPPKRYRLVPDKE